MAFSKCTSPHQKTEQMIPSSSSSSSLSSFSSSSSSASFSFFVLRIYSVFNFVCSHGAICSYMTAGASELLRGGWDPLEPELQEAVSRSTWVL